MKKLISMIIVMTLAVTTSVTFASTTVKGSFTQEQLGNSVETVLEPGLSFTVVKCEDIRDESVVSLSKITVKEVFRTYDELFITLEEKDTPIDLISSGQNGWNTELIDKYGRYLSIPDSGIMVGWLYDTTKVFKTNDGYANTEMIKNHTSVTNTFTLKIPAKESYKHVFTQSVFGTNVQYILGTSLDLTKVKYITIKDLIADNPIYYNTVKTEIDNLVSFINERFPAVDLDKVSFVSYNDFLSKGIKATFTVDVKDVSIKNNIDYSEVVRATDKESETIYKDAKSYMNLSEHSKSETLSEGSKSKVLTTAYVQCPYEYDSALSLSGISTMIIPDTKKEYNYNIFGEYFLYDKFINYKPETRKIKTIDISDVITYKFTDGSSNVIRTVGYSNEKNGYNAKGQFGMERFSSEAKYTEFKLGDKYLKFVYKDGHYQNKIETNVFGTGVVNIPSDSFVTYGDYNDNVLSATVPIKIKKVVKGKTTYTTTYKKLVLAYNADALYMTVDGKTIKMQNKVQEENSKLIKQYE